MMVMLGLNDDIDWFGMIAIGKWCLLVYIYI